MGTLTDSEIIELYKQHWKALYVSAYAILKDKEACEDIIQELFVKIWNNRENLMITSSLQAYLSASVRYEVYRRIRESKRYEPVLDEMAESLRAYSAYDSLEQKELESRISSVIETLSPKCKEVYILSRNERLSHKEIAGRLSISTKTVRNHLTRALHELRVGIQQFLLLLIFLICR